MAKVTLKKAIRTKTITIPGLAGSEVSIKDSILLADMTDDLKKGEESDQAAKMLSKLISSWNFIGDDGNDIPVTPEVIKEYFTANQVAYILAEVTQFASEVKKN